MGSRIWSGKCGNGAVPNMRNILTHVMMAENLKKEQICVFFAVDRFIMGVVIVGVALV
jgi:hypothetical protein